MLLSDLKFITYTDQEDYPKMKALAKHIGISVLNMKVTERGISYFSISPTHHAKKMVHYSPLNINRKWDFTVSIVNRVFMKKYMKGQVYRMPIKYNFTALFKSGLPYDLFKQLFGVKQSDTTLDKKGQREWMIRSHQGDISYYLMVNNKFLYAVEVKEVLGEQVKVEHTISKEWKDKFEQFQYICSTVDK